MNTDVLHRSAKRKSYWLAAAGAGAAGLLMAGALVSIPAPAKAETSLCPEFHNAYYPGGPGQVPGDLDLCTWDTLSPLGKYAEELPVINVHYDSCADWKDSFKAWESAGKLPEAAPAPKGFTSASWFHAASKSSRIKGGNFEVELVFIESPTKPMTITLWQPTWPKMNGAQTSNINQYMTNILAHERGHENLAGKVAAAFTQTYTVTKKEAKNPTAAAQYALTKYGPEREPQFTAAINAVRDSYDGLTNHALRQGALGGVNQPPSAQCPQATLVSADQRTYAQAVLQCEAGPGKTAESVKEDKEAMEFLPPPTFYEATARTLSKPCSSPGSGGTADVPGTLPASGETRSISSSVNLSTSYVGPSGVRSQSAAQSAAVSTTYTDDDGRLTLEGSVKCSTSYDDSGSYQGANGPVLGVSGATRLRFRVDAIMPLELLVSGQPGTADHTLDRHIRIVDRLAAETFITGTVFKKTLFPGVTYEVQFADGCQSGSGNFSYKVIIKA